MQDVKRSQTSTTPPGNAREEKGWNMYMGRNLRDENTAENPAISGDTEVLNSHDSIGSPGSTRSNSDSSDRTAKPTSGVGVRPYMPSLPSWFRGWRTRGATSRIRPPCQPPILLLILPPHNAPNYKTLLLSFYGDSAILSLYTTAGPDER